MHFLKELVSGSLRKFGYRLAKEPTRNDFFLSRQIDTVVDVGANNGQFGKEIRRLGYSGNIVSFEPIKSIYDNLEKIANKDPRWKALNLGISNSNGTATINISEYSAFSSLHQRKAAADAFDSKSAYTRTETITLKTLDAISSKIEGKSIFLKIDTQGHEEAALRGIGSFLDRVEGIQLELPISHLYEGSWTIGESFEYMRSIGFVPTLFYPVNYHTTQDPLALVEVDCVFRRINPSLD